ncbi:MAG: hypothetical protein PHE02_08430 [Lachnospiraceae bacterium]|nr:hypothetical protein [Lachnospiraceae bacterium]
MKSIRRHQLIDIYTHVTEDKYEKEIQKFGTAMNPNILVAGSSSSEIESTSESENEGMQQIFC